MSRRNPSPSGIASAVVATLLASTPDTVVGHTGNGWTPGGLLIAQNTPIVLAAPTRLAYATWYLGRLSTAIGSVRTVIVTDNAGTPADLALISAPLHGADFQLAPAAWQQHTFGFGGQVIPAGSYFIGLEMDGTDLDIGQNTIIDTPSFWESASTPPSWSATNDAQLIFELWGTVLT